MRKALSIAAALVALFLIGSRAWGQTPAKPVLAVLPLDAEGVSGPMAAQVTRALQEELAKLECFELVPREEVEAATSRRTGAFDAASAAAVGKELLADKAVWGLLARSENEYIIRLGLVDVPTAREKPLLPGTQKCQAADMPVCLRGIAWLLAESGAPGFSPAVASEEGSGPARFGKPLSQDEVQKRWHAYSTRVAVGTVIVVPSLAWTLLTVVGMFGHSEYKGLALFQAIPAFVGSVAGIALISGGRKGLAELKKQMGGIQIEFRHDPGSRSWGFTLGYSF